MPFLVIDYPRYVSSYLSWKKSDSHVEKQLDSLLIPVYIWYMLWTIVFFSQNLRLGRLLELSITGYSSCPNGGCPSHKKGSLKTTSSSQVGQHLHNVFGHRWGNGQMITFSLETVFIGRPVNGEHNTFWSDVRIRSTRNGANVLGFRSESLLESAGFYLNSILTGKAESRQTWTAQ